MSSSTGGGMVTFTRRVTVGQNAISSVPRAIVVGSVAAIVLVISGELSLATAPFALIVIVGFALVSRSRKARAASGGQPTRDVGAPAPEPLSAEPQSTASQSTGPSSTGTPEPFSAAAAASSTPSSDATADPGTSTQAEPQPVSDELRAQVRELRAAGRTMEAVERLRAETGMELYEASRFVMSMEVPR